VIDDPNVIYGLWELRNRAWLLRSGAELHAEGLFAELNGYQALVFLDIRPLPDPDGRLKRFAATARGWLGDWHTALAASEAPSKPPTKSPVEVEVDAEEELLLKSPPSGSDANGVEE